MEAGKTSDRVVMGYDILDFQKEVIDLSGTIPVLVDFWAEWCGPCRILTPTLEKLAERHPGEWELKKLNTEKFPEIASRYDIRNIPNVKLFVDGSIINEFVGALSESAIEEWLKASLPDKFNRTLDEAEKRIREQRYSEAQPLIEPVLVSSPDHERAHALMGLTLVFTDPARALNLVSTLDEGSRFSEYAETVHIFCAMIGKLADPSSLPEAEVRPVYLDGIQYLSEGHFDEALTHFVQVIKTDRYYDDDGSRKACIAIFKYLGEDNEVSLKHRREFGNALYT